MASYRPHTNDSPGVVIAWSETLSLTAGALALGLWLSPEDPLLAEAAFPWPVLGPVLAALRYGFAQGLIASLLLIAGTLIATGMPEQLWGAMLNAQLGMIATAAAAGEFRDAWSRRIQQLQRHSEFSQQRLGEFSRAFHLLQLSHQQLEQRLAGSSMSLREAIADLRRRLGEAFQSGPASTQPFAGCADTIMAIFGEYGSLATASLHAVEPAAHHLDAPAATLGEMPTVRSDDPLIQEALTDGRVVSVGHYGTGDDADDTSDTDLIATIPLTTAQGAVEAVVAVRHMPFFALTRANLQLLAVLAGHVADSIRTARETGVSDPETQTFEAELKRAEADAQRFGLASGLVALKVPASEAAQQLRQRITERQRGLDVLWQENDANGTRMLVLLPLTDRAGVSGYETRLQAMSQEFHGGGLETFGIKVAHLIIEPGVSPSYIQAFITRTLGIDFNDMVS